MSNNKKNRNNKPQRGSNTVPPVLTKNDVMHGRTEVAFWDSFMAKTENSIAKDEELQKKAIHQKKNRDAQEEADHKLDQERIREAKRKTFNDYN